MISAEELVGEEVLSSIQQNRVRALVVDKTRHDGSMALARMVTTPHLKPYMHPA